MEAPERELSDEVMGRPDAPAADRYRLVDEEMCVPCGSYMRAEVIGACGRGVPSGR